MGRSDGDTSKHSSRKRTRDDDGERRSRERDAEEKGKDKRRRADEGKDGRPGQEESSSSSSSSGPRRCRIWDLDETLIVFQTLLDFEDKNHRHFAELHLSSVSVSRMVWVLVLLPRMDVARFRLAACLHYVCSRGWLCDGSF